MKVLLTLATIFILGFAVPGLGQTGRCDPDEVKVGEDRLRIYCMQTSVVTTCRSKGGDLARCVNAGCVKAAGEDLGSTRVNCKDENVTCLGEQGAAPALIEGISNCILGLALTENPVAACFVGGLILGGGKYDNAVATCKIKFGKCMEPALNQHKHFVTLCGRYRP
jgi:hypothetical protein